MEQGELVQVVEYHAQQASTNVDKAEKQLEKARELKIKSLKVSANNLKQVHCYYKFGVTDILHLSTIYRRKHAF